MKVQGDERAEVERCVGAKKDWRMTLFVVVMLPLVLGLAVWQLQRADYKQALMDSYFDKLGGLPQTLVADSPTPAEFTRVRLRGNYEQAHLLLDNQLSNGRPGYWVYSPFTLEGVTWLVNRGWIAAPASRDQLPEVPAVPKGEIQLVALVWPDTGSLPLFGEEPHEQLGAEIWRLQRLDFSALPAGLESVVGGQLMNAELRLEDAQPGVLQAVPQTMAFGVARHHGYAFQWFGLGIALIVGYIFYRRSLTASPDG